MAKYITLPECENGYTDTRNGRHYAKVRCKEEDAQYFTTNGKEGAE